MTFFSLLLGLLVREILLTPERIRLERTLCHFLHGPLHPHFSQPAVSRVDTFC